MSGVYFPPPPTNLFGWDVIYFVPLLFVHLFFENAVSDAFEHPTEVEQYAVWEKGATDASGFLGYAYLDLFPRGKYILRLIIA